MLSCKTQFSNFTNSTEKADLRVIFLLQKFSKIGKYLILKDEIKRWKKNLSRYFIHSWQNDPKLLRYSRKKLYLNVDDLNFYWLTPLDFHSIFIMTYPPPRLDFLSKLYFFAFTSFGNVFFLKFWQTCQMVCQRFADSYSTTFNSRVTNLFWKNSF